MSWFSRKYNCISLSTIEVECIASGNGCTQLIWMKNMFKDYDVPEEVLTLYYDNLSVVNILKDHVQHSRTKHIDIHHHCIRNMVEDKIIYLQHISTTKQLTDSFTKGFDVPMYEYLKSSPRLCVM